MAITKPKSLVTPFAVNGQKNVIPVASQIGIDDGKASYVTGYPPLTMQNIASGGIPPQGMDENGILYEISAHSVWQNAGGIYKFDVDIATHNNGYPVGAVLWNDVGDQTYRSLVANNTVNFNTTPASIGVSWEALSARVLAGVSNYNLNTTLSAANDVNKLITLGSATFDLTIPPANLCKQGTTIQLVAQGGNQTIKASGADVFGIGATNVASFLLNLSGFCTLVSNGINKWIVSGSPTIPASKGEVPIGGVIIYSGSFANIPANWALCDGSNGTPDMRDRMVMGAGGSYAVGQTGGGNTTSTNGGGVTGDTSLTLAQIPPHNHTYWGNVPNHVQADDRNGSENTALGANYPQATDVAGSGQPHNHSIANHNHTLTPPYIAFGYIIRKS